MRNIDFFGPLDLFFPQFPEAQRFVPTSTHDEISTGTLGQKKNSVRVSFEAGEFVQALGTPHVYFVVGEPVRRDQIVVFFRKKQVAHLALSVLLQRPALLSQVPNSHSSVRSARSRCEVAHLSIRPFDCFHRCLVGLLENRKVCFGGKHEHLVVVSPRGEILFVWSPTQSTDFLGVLAKNLGWLLVLPQIIHKNVLVLRTRD